VVTILLVTAINLIFVVAIHIVAVTIEIFITTILACCGYINKTFCGGNKVIFSLHATSENFRFL